MFASEKALVKFDDLNRLIPGLAADRGWYSSGNFGDTLSTPCFPLNAYKRTAPGAFSARLFSPSSLHPGSVNVLMGDGAVRFINENIDSWPADPVTGEPIGATDNPGGWWENEPAPGLWQALSTRAGSETVDNRF